MRKLVTKRSLRDHLREWVKKQDEVRKNGIDERGREHND